MKKLKKIVARFFKKDYLSRINEAEKNSSNFCIFKLLKSSLLTDLLSTEYDPIGYRCGNLVVQSPTTHFEFQARNSQLLRTVNRA
jgi:hypothetical protein